MCPVFYTEALYSASIGLLAFQIGFDYHNPMVLDLVVLGILLVSAIVAFMRGFVREILTIGSLVGAALATFLFAPMLTPFARGWLVDPNAAEPQQLFGMIPYEMLAPVVAYAVVFVVVLILLTIVTHMVSKGVHSVGLGPVDRSLGVVFGLVRGVIIVGLMSLVMNFVLSDEQRTSIFGESKTYPYVGYLADLTNALLPGREVLDRVHDKKEKAEAAAQIPATGREPLEPGQANGGRSSGGYTQKERKKLETLIEAPQKTTTQQFNN